MKISRIILPLAILLGFGFGCRDKVEMAELEKYKAQAEVEEQNKDIVRRWLSELDKGNFAIVDEVIAEDCQAHYTGETFGREWLRASCEAFPKSFSNSVHIIDDLVAEKDKVVARLTVRATNTGEFMGAAATGETVEYSAYTIYRMTGGKIQEIWVDQNAVLELMTKLGMELKPKEEVN